MNYTYDGSGMRVEKSNGTLYWRSYLGPVLEETDASGNVQRDYVFFAQRRIAWRDSSGNAYYYFADKLGSTRVVTNSSGGTCFEADYYPYGEENDYAASCSPTYKFTGYEFDSETGAYYAYAREYDPRIGRFLSADPSGSTPDTPSGPVLPDALVDAYADLDERCPIADRRRRSWLLGGVYTLALAPQTNGLVWDPAGISGLRRFGGQEVTHSGLWVTAEEVAAMELARTNPQGWNGYAYVLGNPATAVDGFGLAAPPSTTNWCKAACVDIFTLHLLECSELLEAPWLAAACEATVAVMYYGCLQACNRTGLPR